MSSPSPCRQDLQHTAVDLDIERQNVTTDVREYAVFEERMPEGTAVERSDLALLWAGVPVDWKDWMVPKDEFVPRLRMLGERLIEPVS